MDNVLLNDEAREKLIKGADKVADATALTLGVAGSAAIIEDFNYPFHRVVDDGVSVAKAIKLEDKYENMGANLIREIAGQADKDSGDGTTTATVISRSLLHGWKKGMNTRELKNSLDETLPIVFKFIDDQTLPIEPEDVDKVAYTSSNDKELAFMLKEIYSKVGKEGIVEIDNSNLPETFYELVEGVRLRGAGYLGRYSCNEPAQNPKMAVYKNPYVLVTREKITQPKNLESLLKVLAQNNITELVIYCEDIDMNVASVLAYTHNQGGFKTLIIKAPTLFKDWFYEDFAKITGATILDGREGKTFKNLMLSDLGRCEKIITTNEETRIIGIKDISEHLAQIKDKLKDDPNLAMRLSWLQTKVVILKMGANSEAELSQKKAKAIDAISACHHALQGGVVIGGGRVFDDIQLPDTIGGTILKEALEAPKKQMEVNADTPMSSKEELKRQGIYDPAQIVKNSVKAAVSIAGAFLSTKIAITLNEIPR